MKYRWGFLDENDAFSECFPKVDDGTAIDFAPESGEVFYRAKLNGKLSFQYEFDAILAEGYNYEHKIVLQWYDADSDEWKEVWKGRFALTDCEIDYDTKTITVTPETLDRYTKILDNLDKDYNIVKLAPAMQPVNILIRPCLQVYLFGASKIYNYVGGNSWDSSCDAVLSTDDLATYKFEELRDCLWFTGTYKSGVYAGKKAIFYGRFLFLGSDVSFPMDGRVYNSDGTYTEEEGAFTCYITHDNGHDWLFSIMESGTSNMAIACFYDDRSGIDNNESYTEGNIFENTYLRWDRIFGRTICNTDLNDVTISGTTYSLYQIAASDMAGANLNYNKIMQKAFATIYPSIDTSLDPTSWPQDTFDRYFVKPQNTPTRIYFAASPDEWMDVAFWWYAGAQESEVEEKLTTARTIRDAYDYRQTIFRLLGKADVNPPLIISGCLGGSNDYVGTRTNLIITPRSNVITSYYDTPAQNAPISLAKIFSMLKQAFKAYWHVDSNGNLHIEHISYYDNGLNYTDSPQLLVDLESEMHTNTKNNKVFGQNKVKFDKQDMPAQFTFGWADVVTRPFIGYPINCLDAYVQKGTKEEKVIGDFDSDVDFVLSSPNDVSKEGFFLFALPAIEGGGYSTTLKIDTVTITDEIGDTYEVTIQNGDAAFVKIHETWWRYSLPCENVNINNENTTAKTTGRFKLQSVEFADTIMAEILKDIDNCNKVLRTQQGEGHIKSISVNLNSLVAKGDLLFNFVGRWFYLKGLALGNSFIAIINGESITIDVSANKFSYRYKEPIATMKFAAADVVSVNFADCDNLDNLTSCDEMFDGCEELLAVDFGGKTFAAVTTANNMFRGCVALTTLICPDSSSWKADLDLSDCPAMTTESFYDLIKFLYYYDSGVHTITPNTTFWNALDADTQNDLLTKASARGWTIGIPAQYSISGQSAANTVYATINGSSVEIPVTGGYFQYDYNTPITSISFENDADVTDIDFSLSDGLAGVTSLNDAFKNCAGLTSVDFTNCDLSNVASASDAFANCTSLYELIIPSGTWKPDIDLSAGVMPKAEMLNVITGLYLYTSGTHTITFNSTIWNAMSVADQQAVWNAADAKGWETNAVAVVYTIQGTSSNVNGQETFKIQFIQNGAMSPDAPETITCNVDGNGNWNYSYQNKKIYSLLVDSVNYGAFSANTILSVEIDEDLSELTSMAGLCNGNTHITSFSAPNGTFAKCANLSYQNGGTFNNCTSLVSVNMPNAIFGIADGCGFMFDNCTSLQSVDLRSATFATAISTEEMFWKCSALTDLKLDNATFASVTNSRRMFRQCTSIINLSMQSATFASLTLGGNNNSTGYGMFAQMNSVVTIDLQSATFDLLATAPEMFRYDTKLETININSASFAVLYQLWAMFDSCTKLTTIIIGRQNVMNAELDFKSCPLTYDCAIDIANWCKDLTGLSAKTITFRANSWNNVYSQQQRDTIDAILSGKNWNRAIA